MGTVGGAGVGNKGFIGSSWLCQEKPMVSQMSSHFAGPPDTLRHFVISTETRAQEFLADRRRRKRSPRVKAMAEKEAREEVAAGAR